MKLNQILKNTNTEHQLMAPYFVREHANIDVELLKTMVGNKAFAIDWQQKIAAEMVKYMIPGITGVVFDLEATCEDKKINTNFDNEVIEIGAVKVVNGLIISEFSHFIKPKDTKITPFCTSLTTIRESDVEKAKTFPDVFNAFKEFAGNLSLLSWGLYDKKQLVKDINRHKMNYALKTWVENNHRSLKHEHGKALNLKQGRGVGVPTALKMINESFDGTHHRGIDDAYNIAKIFIKNKEIFLNVK